MCLDARFNTEFVFSFEYHCRKIFIMNILNATVMVVGGEFLFQSPTRALVELLTRQLEAEDVVGTALIFYYATLWLGFLLCCHMFG